MTDDGPEANSTDESEASDVREGPPGLMTGSEQWWEFLAETQRRADTGDDESDSGLELADVKAANRREPAPSTGLAPSAHSFVCANCRAQNPADLTFCLNCGAEPRGALQSRTDLFVVRECPEGPVRDFVADAVAAASAFLDTDDVHALLEKPPAYLLLDGRPRQQEALVERLLELDVEVESVSPTEPDTGWHREIAESVLRDTGQIALFGGSGMVTVVVAIWLTAWMLVPGAVAMAYLYRRRRDWYRRRYNLQTERVLESVAGLHPSMADSVQELLRELDDDAVDRALTRCLLGYYTIQHRLAPGTGVRGVLTERVRPLASDLLHRVVEDCDRYLELQRLLDGGVPDEATGEKAEDVQERIRARLERVADRFDALRARVVTASLEEDRDDAALDDAIDELEREIDVLDETLAEFEQAPAHQKLPSS